MACATATPATEAAPRRRPDPYQGYLPLDYRSHSLGATLTHAKRDALWIPADPDFAGADGRLGQLTIKVQEAKGWRRKIDVDTYILEPSLPEPGDEGGRPFWLMNVTDPDAEEPYRVVLDTLVVSGGRLELVDRCNCRAGQCKLDCKHVSAIRMLTETGDI